MIFMQFLEFALMYFIKVLDILNGQQYIQTNLYWHILVFFNADQSKEVHHIQQNPNKTVTTVGMFFFCFFFSE